MIYIPGQSNVWVFDMNFIKAIAVRYKLLLIFFLIFFIFASFSFYILGTLSTYDKFLDVFKEQVKNNSFVSSLATDINTTKSVLLGSLGVLFVLGLSFVVTLSVILEKRIKNQQEHFEADKNSLLQLKIEKESVDQQIRLQTQQLRDEQSRLEASINSLTIGYIMVDNFFNVLKINDQARQILEIDSAIADQAQENYLTLDYIQQILGKSVNLSLATKSCLLGKKHIQIRDVLFKTKFFKIFISPVDNVTNVKNPHFKVIGAVILLEDVTEAKVIERSRDEFFSIASHELRTPLTVIRGNTSMIKSFYSDKLQDPDLKEMIDDTHNSSIRLITIVNDFLDVSRLEQKKMLFKRESFEIEKLVNEVIKELSSLAEEKQLMFTFQNSPESHTLVLGDRDRSKEVLLNLCNNAIKYTDKGSVKVSLDKKPALMKILVADTGRGVPDENKALLFRKFQQASNNILTRDNTRSTGLGLYISKLLAEGMGGDATLEYSTLNVGSVFAFTLPVGVQV